jgi:RNA polymerase sigma-70 factor (ECF subfamily)
MASVVDHPLRMGRREKSLEVIEELYRARFPAFVRVAQTILRDRERARDAVQDGFADAIRARGDFRGEGPLEAWVWRCVVNAALKAARQRVDLAVVPDDGSESEAAVFAVSPLVSSLPERQRLVVFLRYYAGLDYRAIAEVMEVEVGTVSATLASAHANVRKRLEEAEAHA